VSLCLTSYFSVLHVIFKIPPLVSYNQEYLQTRLEMCTPPRFNKRHKTSLLTAEGIVRIDRSQRRTLRQIQLMSCLSDSCKCSRHMSGFKCSTCLLFCHSGVWNETADFIDLRTPLTRGTKPYVYFHETDRRIHMLNIHHTLF
jgi:hypothetical protein